jgi:hypothetical protein
MAEDGVADGSRNDGDAKALAHLNCLLVRGRAVAIPDADGVVWYGQA